jgi:hypothetical protein
VHARAPQIQSVARHGSSPFPTASWAAAPDPMPPTSRHPAEPVRTEDENVLRPYGSSVRIRSILWVHLRNWLNLRAAPGSKSSRDRKDAHFHPCVFETYSGEIHVRGILSAHDCTMETVSGRDRGARGSSAKSKRSISQIPVAKTPSHQQLLSSNRRGPGPFWVGPRWRGLLKVLSRLRAAPPVEGIRDCLTHRIYR